MREGVLVLFFVPIGWFPAIRSGAGVRPFLLCKFSPWWASRRDGAGQGRFKIFVCPIFCSAVHEVSWCLLPLAGRGGEERKRMCCSSATLVEWLSRLLLYWCNCELRGWRAAPCPARPSAQVGACPPPMFHRRHQDLALVGECHLRRPQRESFPNRPVQAIQSSSCYLSSSSAVL